MQPITSIREIADRYDAFIIDLWGVMHDGTSLYPGARDAIAFLHESGKKVLFLSNAPRKAARAEETLLKFGIAREQFAQVVTSGQVAFDRLRADPVYGRRYYYLGPGKDEDVLAGLHARLTDDERDEDVLENAESEIRSDNPAEADFILNTGFEYDYQPEAEVEPLLQRLRAHHLPLLCVNPDIEVVKQDGTRLLCAGWVARRYEQLGGRVDYIGKPHPEVYTHSLNLLGNPPRTLCIGDNLLTDILGANRMGLDSLLITGGILKSEQGRCPEGAELEELCAQAGAMPTYSAALFAA